MQRLFPRFYGFLREAALEFAKTKVILRDGLICGFGQGFASTAAGAFLGGERFARFGEGRRHIGYIGLEPAPRLFEVVAFGVELIQQLHAVRRLERRFGRTAGLRALFDFSRFLCEISGVLQGVLLIEVNVVEAFQQRSLLR